MSSDPDEYTAAHRWIPGSQLFVEYFGYWPSFHDTELLEVRMVPGDDLDRCNAYIDFFLVVGGLDFTDEDVIQKTMKYCRAVMRFEYVKQVWLWDFSFSNWISEIRIVPRPEADLVTWEPKYSIKFGVESGLEADFQCSNIRVLSVTPYNDDYVRINAAPSEE